MFLIACGYRAVKSFLSGDIMSERKQQYSEMTDAEKEAIFKICKKFIWFLEKARREGILAIEENLDSLHEEMGGINGVFMQKLLYLVVDGTDGNIISYIANHYADSTCQNDYERLCFAIIQEGTLSLQNGDNPRILAERLASYVGLSESDSFLERIYDNYDRRG